MSTLTTTERDELYATLVQKRERLIADLQRTREAREQIQELLRSEGSVMDLAEQSNEIEQLDHARAGELSLRIDLAEVEHAIDKFAAGRYGLCEACGEPIPVRRLRILPEARFDTAHQAQHELRAPEPEMENPVF
jgi:RNA polymerase-binding transcription factor DksA